MKSKFEALVRIILERASQDHEGYYKLEKEDTSYWVVVKEFTGLYSAFPEFNNEKDLPKDEMDENDLMDFLNGARKIDPEEDADLKAVIDSGDLLNLDATA